MSSVALFLPVHAFSLFASTRQLHLDFTFWTLEVFLSPFPRPLALSDVYTLCLSLPSCFHSFPKLIHFCWVSYFLELLVQCPFALAFSFLCLSLISLCLLDISAHLSSTLSICYELLHISFTWWQMRKALRSRCVSSNCPRV